MKHMSPGKPGDIYSILNEKSDNMAFELLVESAIDDVNPEQVYQELFLTTSRNAKKRLRRWTETVEDVLKDINSYQKNDQLNAGLIATEFGNVYITTYVNGIPSTRASETAYHHALTFIVKKLEIVTERKRTSKAFDPSQMDQLKDFRNDIRDLVRTIDACVNLTKEKATNTVLNNAVKDVVEVNTKCIETYSKVRSFIHNSDLNFNIE